MGRAVAVRSWDHSCGAHRPGTHFEEGTGGCDWHVSKTSEATVRAMSKAYKVAIVGATGAVGVEFLRCFEERQFPISEIHLLASARSKGKKMPFAGRDIAVEELTEDSFQNIDIAFFSAGGSISKKYGPIAAKAGAVVVDNSSAFS